MPLSENGIRPWTNAGGIDNDGGVDTAADECLINYTRVPGTNTRTVAVDANNDVWTGGADNDHQRVSGGPSGGLIGSERNFGCGGYGGLVDQAGTLWSARFGTNLLRYEPGPDTGACLDTSHGDYGLGLDPNTNHVWHTNLSGNRIVELVPAGNVLNAYRTATNGRRASSGPQPQRVGRTRSSVHKRRSGTWARTARSWAT